MGDRIPRVTVLMPAYNAARWVVAAAQSVLEQQGPLFELLAVDDGSTDQTPALLSSLRDPRVRVLRQPKNQGLVAALNLGLTEARGDYVARLDADDLCMPDRLRLQTEAMDADPAAVVVASQTEVIDAADRHITWSRYAFSPETIFHTLVFRNCLCHSAVMMRRKAALAEGGYRAQAVHAEDFDLWGRLSRKGRIVMIPKPLVKARVHGESVSARQAAAQNAMVVQIVEANLTTLLGTPPGPATASALAAVTPSPSLSRADLRRAAQDFVAVQRALYLQRPDCLSATALTDALQISYSRWSHSFRQVGIALPPSPLGPPTPTQDFEGRLRAWADVRPRRWARLLPRTRV